MKLANRNLSNLESRYAVLYISDIFSVEFDDNNWYVDNGAINHVCDNEKQVPMELPVDRVGSGDLQIKFFIQGFTSKVILYG